MGCTKGVDVLSENQTNQDFLVLCVTTPHKQLIIILHTSLCGGANFPGESCFADGVVSIALNLYGVWLSILLGHALIY